MSAPPYMPFYVADYLSDTRHLSTEEHGAYLLLLMALWRSGGRLPKEGAKLARICGLTPSKWAKMEDDILAFFEVGGDEIGHKRIAKEFEKYTRTCERRAASGSKGGRAKSLKTNVVELASARDLPQQNDSNSRHNQNQNQNKKKDIDPQPSEKTETPQSGQAARRGTRLPEGWSGNPPGEAVIAAIREGLTEPDAFKVLEDFRDFWLAKAGADAAKLDWMATWRRWLREEIRRRGKRPTAGPQKRVSFV